MQKFSENQIYVCPIIDSGQALVIDSGNVLVIDIEISMYSAVPSFQSLRVSYYIKLRNIWGLKYPSLQIQITQLVAKAHIIGNKPDRY